MKHILNIAFDFDDDKVRSIAEQAVAENMDDLIDKIIKDRIAPERSLTWDYSKKERDWTLLYEKVDNAISDMLAEHKEEIIERASVKLVESLKRTKAWKEKYEKILD